MWAHGSSTASVFLRAALARANNGTIEGIAEIMSRYPALYLEVHGETGAARAAPKALADFLQADRTLPEQQRLSLAHAAVELKMAKRAWVLRLQQQREERETLAADMNSFALSLMSKAREAALERQRSEHAQLLAQTV